VVIDVIRAFTTAAIAFERGAADIACTRSADAGTRTACSPARSAA